MKPSDVIAEFARRGITLTARGDRLVITGRLATNVKAYLAAHKKTLLEALRDLGEECGRIYDEWRADPNPDDQAWAQKYAYAAIAAGFGYYGKNGTTDGGTDGWLWFARKTWILGLGTVAVGEYAEAMNGLAVVSSDWPADASRPILIVEEKISPNKN